MSLVTKKKGCYYRDMIIIGGGFMEPDWWIIRL
jgi:hypothetical protein